MRIEPRIRRPYALSTIEETLVTMNFADWQKARATSTYTCEQMAMALAKRAQYMQHVQHMNHFMYWDSFDWIGVTLKQARALDALAAGNTAALAPFYCYPLPVKGTMATIDFPSSAGFAVLQCAALPLVYLPLVL